MPIRDVYIHAGAHRTGTSSFQMCLYQNQEQLSEQGFSAGFPGRDGIPEGTIGLRLPAPRHGDGATKRFARSVSEVLQRFPENKPLILSEENILGRMLHFYEGRFYPAAEARLRALRAGLGKARVRRLMLVVRSYDQLCVSGFRKRAEENVVTPFATLRDGMAQMDRGWVEIVTLIRDIMKPEHLLVLTYESRGTSIDLMQRLVPDLTPASLVEPSRTMNQSATDAALDVLQGRLRDKETLTRAQIEEVIAQHTDQKESRGFAEFTDAQAKSLRARYEADLALLSDMDGVDFAG